MKRTVSNAVIPTLIAVSTAMPAAGDTLENVRSRGVVQCGVAPGVPGFSNPDTAGNWQGLDADFCRAVATAVLGAPDKVKFIPLSGKERFVAVQSGEVDLLSRKTTNTVSREIGQGVDFVGTIFYDGQGFMVPKALGMKAAKDLEGASICTMTGTTSEQTATEYFRSHNMSFDLVVFEKEDEAVAAYDGGRCDTITFDKSTLAAYRIKLKNPEDHMILPDTISKEPLAPAVRHGDNRWGDIVSMTLNALIEAEELDLTAAKIDEQKAEPANPAIERFLGVGADFGKDLNLPADWMGAVIKAVGNYGEIYDRNVGPNTKLGLERGINSLWSHGGLHYGNPVR